MLKRYLQKCFYQHFGHDLARDSLRDLDYSGEVELIDPRFNLPSRTGRSSVGPKAWVHLVELPHLPIGPPAQIAVAGVLQIERGNLVEPARSVECGSALIRYRLVVEQCIAASRTDSLFV